MLQRGLVLRGVRSSVCLTVVFCGIFLRGLTEGKMMSCPTFGFDQTSQLARSEARRLFMNFETPSQCAGNVTSWSFCYYRNRRKINDEDNFEVVLLVYRKNSLSNSRYATVNKSVKEIILPGQVIEISNFNCMNITLTQEEYFEIFPNDILGACIRDTGNNNSLLLVGKKNKANFKTYQIDTDQYKDCTSTQTRTVNTSNPEFQLRNTNILHLYANIAVGDSCNVGNSPPPSVAVTDTSIRGTYLNFQYPVPSCGNYITKWNYCYYTEAAPPGSTLSMTVAVWSLDTDTNTYIVHPNSIRNITTKAIESKAKIFCEENSLNNLEIIKVSSGSVIGIVLNADNPIPIVSAISRSNLLVMKKSDIEILSPIDQSSLISERRALHLHATVELLMNNLKSTDETINFNSIAANSTGINEEEISQGLFSGIIAAIVSSMLILVIAFVIFLIIIIFFKCKVAILHHDADIVMVENSIYGGRTNGTHAEVTTQSEMSLNLFENMEEELDLQTYENELENIKTGNAPKWQADIYNAPADNEKDIYSYMEAIKVIKISGDTITMVEELGSGQFGEVYKGQWKQHGNNKITVAMKVLKNSANQAERLKFLQEAATMAQFKHSNVASLHGVVDDEGMTMLVVEYLSKGDLHYYLNTLKPDPGQLVPALTSNVLLHFSQQICLGMNYLSTIGFVHRDLAARNVLLSSSLVCKIADFGLSRNLHEEDYYTSSGGPIPIKWTAPEALQYKKFSRASDVWSYGCVLYEIWSLGHIPLEQISNVEVLGWINSGKRIAPPPGCPKKIYEVMIMCWSPATRERPSFRDILLLMLDNEDIMLHIPPNVFNSHPQAAILGVSLEASFQMYPDLQMTYLRHQQ